jgi:tyrosinase
MDVDRSKRNRIILFFVFLLAAGGIVGGVVYWRESEKHKAQNEAASASVATSSEEPSVAVSLEGPSNETNSTTPMEGLSSPNSTTSFEESSNPKSAKKSSDPKSAKGSSDPKSAKGSSNSAPKSSSCVNVKVRKEWRDMSDQEQSDFLNAVNEMFKRPSTKGNDNLQMDFVKTHIDQRGAIHHKVSFLILIIDAISSMASPFYFRI